MIQRVQTFYLLLTLFALVMLTLGTDVYQSNIVRPDKFSLDTHANVYGAQKDFTVFGELNEKDKEIVTNALDKLEIPESTKGITTFYFPFFSISILLCMLTVAVILSYKNLKRQLKLGRMLFVFNLLCFITAVVFYYMLRNNADNFPEEYNVQTTLGFGFYCIVIATAFSFLANIGIRRDLRLIQSIDRIR